MSERCCGLEACSCCGSDSWTKAHFRRGQGIVCEACWRSIRATNAKSQPAQRTLPGVELVQPQRAPARIAEPAPEVWGDHVY
jgi:hypothetical protein